MKSPHYTLACEIDLQTADHQSHQSHNCLDFPPPCVTICKTVQRRSWFATSEYKLIAEHVFKWFHGSWVERETLLHKVINKYG